MPKAELKINLLSLVIPAFKQEKTIKEDILNIVSVLNELPYDYEIIVVVDGKLDKTSEKIKSLKNKKVKVLELEENTGKGYSVRVGIMEATGDVVGFLDAGRDIDPTGISMLLNHMVWYDADVIVGSKLHPVSRVNYPFFRRILSWGYRLLTHLLFGFAIKDTQAGIKFFKKKAAKDVFSRSLIKEFAFDVEILALAYTLGYTRIYEAPVKLNFKKGSINTQLIPTIIKMTIDTLAIFYRLKILQYYRKSNKKNWITA